MIQLVAIDLDDTLLQSDLRISHKNLEAIQAARARGIIVGIATGRVYDSVVKYADELGLFGTPGFIISAGGGHALETEGMQTLHQQTLSGDLIDELLLFFNAHEVPVEVHHQGCSYATRDGRWVREDCRLAGLNLQVVDDLETRIRDIPAYKLLIAEEQERIEQLFVETNITFGERISTVISKPQFLEVLPAGVNKGTALERVAAHFSVGIDQCMAIGDGHNDLEMIRSVGCGVAVRNGNEELKRIADYVTTGTNEESAVAEALEHLLSGDFLTPALA